MCVFLRKAAFCLAVGGAAAGLFFGGFVIGYRGGYEQALHDEDQRFPALLLTPRNTTFDPCRAMQLATFNRPE